MVALKVLERLKLLFKQPEEGEILENQLVIIVSLLQSRTAVHPFAGNH